MELSVSHKHCHLVLILLSLFLFSCRLGRAQTGFGGSGINGNGNGNGAQTGFGGSGINGNGNGNVPQNGIVGSGINGNIPQTGIAGSGTGYIPQPGAGGTGVNNVPFTGTGSQNPVQIAQSALICLYDKNIYSSCDEEYRLTETGYLNVPPEYTDQYCGGPCVTETHHVLDCINSVLSHFLFYNQATVRDVEETIKEGCSYGPNRGDFNVAEHIQEYNSGYKSSSYSFVLGFTVLVTALIIMF